MKQTLIDVTPAKGIETYLQHRHNELSEQTLKGHKYRLKHLKRWCNENDIALLKELQPHHIQDYMHWRQQDGNLNEVSLRGQMCTVRVFLKWGEDYGAIKPGLHKNVRIPNPDNETRDTNLTESTANLILDYLGKYEYASNKHTFFALLWHTSMRLGSARALDVEDFHPDEQYIELRHRPDEDTPLKNKTNGERPVYIADEYVTLIQDYIEGVRHDVTDEYNRHPLFTTSYGRPALTTFREWIYHISRPCEYNGNHCPHGREISDCEAAQKYNSASKCPSSISPHTIRRGSITHWLQKDEDGTTKKLISERVNATEDIIEKHYDKRSELEKMEQRKDLFFR